MQLKGQLDAYAAGDYEEAYRLFREAYRHMVMTGDTLADAIVQQNADMFSEVTEPLTRRLRITAARLRTDAPMDTLPSVGASACLDALSSSA